MRSTGHGQPFAIALCSLLLLLFSSHPQLFQSRPVFLPLSGFQHRVWRGMLADDFLRGVSDPDLPPLQNLLGRWVLSRTLPVVSRA